MPAIKNIIFDFGNVLFDIDLPAIERNLRPLIGNSFEKAMEQWKQDKIFELYETGGISTDEFVDTICRVHQPALSATQVIAAWNSIFIGMPRQRFDMLLQLRQRYNVFLLSNINHLHESWIAEYMVREHSIDDYESRYFDGVYFSHLLRLRKPESSIYEYVLADAEILASESIFFDDLLPNVEAANTLGIRGILHPLGMEIEEHVHRLGLL